MAGKKDRSDKMIKLQEQLEQLDKMANPPHVRALQEQIDRITNAANSPGMRAFQEQIDRITNATSSPAMRMAQEQIDRMTNAVSSPAMRAFQEQIDQMTNAASSPAMRAFQEQIDQMTNAASSPAMRLAQEQIDRITKAASSPAMRMAQEQIDRIAKAASSPAMRMAQEQIDRITKAANSPGMRAIQDQIDRMNNAASTPYVRAYQEQVDRMAVAANDSRMSNWLAQTAVAYQELTAGSVLANYLVSASEPGEPATQTVEVAGFDSLEIGDWAELNVGDLNEVDSQIVVAIQSGQVDQLPEPATRRLQFVLAHIVVLWDMMLRIFNTCMAVVYLSALMSNATVPADIPKLAEQIPIEQRVLLTDYRVVNRERANLRTEPSKTAEVIIVLKLGLPVEVLESNGKGWFLVAAEYEGESVEGWIHLTVTSPIPPLKHPKPVVTAAD